MGFTTVPDKASGDVFTEAMWDTFIKDNFNTGVPVLLANVTLGAPAASITLSSIPQTHSHLYVQGYFRCEQAVTITGAALRINGDTGSNYDTQYLGANGGSAAAGELFGVTSDNAFSCFCPGSTATANVFGAASLWIPDYTDTGKNKMVLVESGGKWGTATTNIITRQTTIAWRSSVAVTSLSWFNISGANLSTGSRVSLYGMP